MNDIVEIGPWTPQKKLFDTLEKRSNRDLDMIKRLMHTLDLSYDFFDNKEGLKLLYDIGSHRFCVWVEVDFLPIRPYNAVIRASSIEEWFFGSRITIGQVPKILRYFNKEPPKVWNNFMEFYAGEIPPFNVQPHLYTDPLFILKIYIWLLHEVADCQDHFYDFSLQLAGYGSPHGILSIFVALMDGHACPICHVRVLERVKELLPELPLELVDVLFSAVPATHRSSETTDPIWLPPQSIEIDALMR
ncbi:uncharacterized protein GGS22DRAFT_192023 [Annulohypoxylon maeteangense]|uniref:uncharacterized protein n=1 Tax=Annulohypoxylon maeteangense TaxID=1927788 RepID=UPI0020078A04|nr:uncharacterized protein GGS22DRAFT_192023 [Annulohypoxylon maeteangense]KAI0881829.1 hypothetical protein GGS22DRAFT_192023 [Annulohypoxylon maeteangense]